MDGTATAAGDNDLFLRFLDGDEGSFREIASRYQDRAFWVAFNIVKDADAAADVVQDSFLKIIRSGRSFDPRQSFRTWFFRILSNTAIDAWRRSGKRAAASIDDVEEPQSQTREPGEEISGGHLLRAAIAEVMAKLPPKYRQVLVLREIEGLSCAQLAEALMVTNATARWRLHHARKMFQKIWKAENRDGIAGNV